MAASGSLRPRAGKLTEQAADNRAVSAGIVCAMYTRRCAVGPLHRLEARLKLGSDGEGDDLDGTNRHARRMIAAWSWMRTHV
jgi:hypothetical protein